MENNEKTTVKFANWIRSSLSMRMVVVGFLTLILLLPLSYIEDLIYERQQRQESVVNEINEKWGGEVLLYGPILKIPYRTYTKIYKEDAETKKKTIERKVHIKDLYVFPEKLNSKAELFPEIKYRGLYNSVVYKGEMEIDGSFNLPDFDVLDIAEEDILWEKVKVIIKTSNLKGINNEMLITLNKNSYSFVPRYSSTNGTNNLNHYQNITLHSLESKLILRKDTPEKSEIPFHMDIDFNGSKQLKIIPIGKETTLAIKSDWMSPSFIGNYLPYNADKISDTGFDAKWKVLNINRGFGQNYTGNLPDLQAFAFGVNLMLPVDQYQQSVRTAKYGFLVISLTFLVFFLFQSISKVKIHPFQYLMIGIALTIFYVLLLSISEHSNFMLAYIVAGISVIIMISLYSKSILKQTKFTLLITSSLTVLYTFIFVIIQLENYALLVGSIGLFFILAGVMYASRKIDWDS